MLAWDARGCNSPSLIKIFHLLAVVLLAATSARSAVSFGSPPVLLPARGAFPPPAARWCCRTGKCIWARAAGARRQSVPQALLLEDGACPAKSVLLARSCWQHGGTRWDRAKEGWRAPVPPPWALGCIERAPVLPTQGKPANW